MATVTLKRLGYRCERCQHQWEARGPRAQNRPRVAKKTAKPRLCPKCKSPYWDTPRRTAVKKKAQR